MRRITVQVEVPENEAHLFEEGAVLRVSGIFPNEEREELHLATVVLPPSKTRYLKVPLEGVSAVRASRIGENDWIVYKGGLAHNGAEVIEEEQEVSKA